MTTLHWQGKFRGPDFEPMAFEQWCVTAKALKDSKGRNVPTVIARALSADEQQAAASQERTDEDALLILLLEHTDGHLSLAGIAEALRWFDKKGAPYKSKVVRSLKRLEKEKLVTALRGSYDLTDRGKSAAKRRSTTATQPGRRMANPAQKSGTKRGTTLAVSSKRYDAVRFSRKPLKSLPYHAVRLAVRNRIPIRTVPTPTLGLVRTVRRHEGGTRKV